MTPTQPRQAVEAAAKLIYETWKDIPEYRLWQNGGNSLKQDEARRIARQVIELTRQQEVAAPVGVVSVSPLHVGVGWVGGYVPKNGEKLYLAAARVPVASPAEPVIDCDTCGQRVTGPCNAVDCTVPDTHPVGAGGAGVMDARPDSFHSDSGKCDRVQGPGPTDAERLDFLETIGVSYGFEDMHEGNRWMIDGPFMFVRDAIDAAILAKGGDQGEGK